jgi:histidyl-tRNA synthetase
MEMLSTLLGKYGEEGDKLLFRILNSGDFLSGVNNLASDTEAAALMPFVSEKGLRYDLTVPFARYVVQYRNDIVFPFKRYQIQPVWRADRPQKGRYREFYQCDADIVGSDALLNEAELVQMVNDVFKKLSIKVVVKINNRKILAGIANYIGKPEAITDITVAIDKLDKIGIEQVNNELLAKGIDQNAVDKLQPILFMQGSSCEKLQQMAELIGDNETGAKGINEMQTLFDYLEAMHLDLNFELDLTLARGLNYYTGAILEVKATEAQMGSICGGGRYDDLTGIFGMPGVSGVGISFGADRIYDVMKELSLFPEKSESSTAVLFVNFGSAEEKYCLPLLSDLRKAGINSEIYPEADKMKKQMKYADQKKINFVVLAGETEIKSGLLTVKNMLNGEQSDVKTEQLAAYFLEKLH